MPGKLDEASGWWFFDSVQEFWESEGLEGMTACVERDRFWGRLDKGVMIIEDSMARELTGEELQQGCQPNTLMVVQLENRDRSGNWRRLSTPPPRTGKFDAFMDEVEEVAIRFGCQFVWVDQVVSDFLPEKFERRGYQRIENFAHRPQPDFVKALH